MFSGSSRLIYTVVLSLVGVSAWCAPSGLSSIPTTDVLESGTVSIETESNGSGRPWGRKCDHFSLLQVGLGKGVEIGVDRCLNNPDHWLNGKWKVVDETAKRPAIAFGMQAVSDNESSQPYLVISKSLSVVRAHAGVIKLDGRLRNLYGVDYTLNKRMTLVADRINGNGNSLTYGLAVNMSNRFSMTVARTKGNSAEINDGYIVNLSYLISRK